MEVLAGDCQKKVACRRLAKAAGRKRFGNARAVRKLFEHEVKEAMSREDLDEELMFQTVDLLGERPSTNPRLQEILDEVAGEALEDEVRGKDGDEKREDQSTAKDEDKHADRKSLCMRIRRRHGRNTQADSR
ncbi:hypothetical protein PsorP6_010758 [Peronosclerospora sorghi]|uniref:Uncharacterized protein n=1 Tax=Peronosclerospora sorghi TaxID=230839 RepID=A0ACC0VXR4_9STRA|nr:hypothetical protein PsorP6_010758 [Peronosclerospora sorghi]